MRGIFLGWPDVCDRVSKDAADLGDRNGNAQARHRLHSKCQQYRVRARRRYTGNGAWRWPSGALEFPHWRAVELNPGASQRGFWHFLRIGRKANRERFTKRLHHKNMGCENTSTYGQSSPPQPKMI